MKLTLKDNYSLHEVLKINRLIDGAISIAKVQGSAAICQGGHCCEVGCRICPFKSICYIEFNVPYMRLIKDRFNTFIDHTYFQNRNGN